MTPRCFRHPLIRHPAGLLPQRRDARHTPARPRIGRAQRARAARRPTTPRARHGVGDGRGVMSAPVQWQARPGGGCAESEAGKRRAPHAEYKRCSAIYVMTVPVSIVASIRRCHRRDRGSIPRQEGFFRSGGARPRRSCLWALCFPRQEGFFRSLASRRRGARPRRSRLFRSLAFSSPTPSADDVIASLSLPLGSPRQEGFFAR